MTSDKGTNSRHTQAKGGGQMETSLVPGVLGVALGIAGGALGTYFSIKNTIGPRERRFMVNMSVLVWAVVIIFLIGLFTLPSAYKWFLWIPYGFTLPLCIRYINRKQKLIREDELGT